MNEFYKRLYRSGKGKHKPRIADKPSDHTPIVAEFDW